MSVMITDYIDTADVESEVLGDFLCNAKVEDVEVLLVWHQVINREYLDKFPRLKGVVRYGVGFDKVDLDEIRRRGLVFCNTPDYGTDEVSDTALTMLMQMARRVNSYDYLCRGYKDTWQENTLKGIRRTSSIKLGVIGAGRIGTALIRKAAAIGFDVSFYDPFKDSGYEKAIGVGRHYDLDSLLHNSDVVSLNLPLNIETVGFVNEDFIRKMKPGASLINTARGELVCNLDILYQALRDDRLHSVGLDVLPSEPPSDEPFINAWRAGGEFSTRIIINPHTAYYSVESYFEMRQKASQNAKRILLGETPLNIIVEGKS